MPARYFPMSQEFNSDPQGWELTDKFGDRSIRIWIEILAILDREKNCWKLVDNWEKVIARKARQSPATVQRVVGWLLASGWLEVGQTLASGRPEVLRARNYHKYRKIAAGTNPPPNLSSPNLSSPKIQSAPTAVAEKKELDPRIKAVGDAIYRSDKVKFSRLIVWIKDKLNRDYPPEIIAAALESLWEQEKKVKIKNWWPYIERIHSKLYGQWNEQQAANRKADDSKFSLAIASLVKSI